MCRSSLSILWFRRRAQPTARYASARSAWPRSCAPNGSTSANWPRNAQLTQPLSRGPRRQGNAVGRQPATRRRTLRSPRPRPRAAACFAADLGSRLRATQARSTSRETPLSTRGCRPNLCDATRAPGNARNSLYGSTGPQATVGATLVLSRPIPSNAGPVALLRMHVFVISIGPGVTVTVTMDRGRLASPASAPGFCQSSDRWSTVVIPQRTASIASHTSADQNTDASVHPAERASCCRITDSSINPI